MKKLLSLVVLLLAAGLSYGQAVSTNGGSIQGTVTDPTGAVVSGASISVVSSDTGFSKALQTDSAGYYSVGPLNPGGYVVTITSPSFSVLKLTTVVRTGTATSGNAKLTISKTGEVVNVVAGAIQVNTDQVGVSDVLTNDQIQTLPINGRNFLDIAQIEPGVILQSGQSFDPTKAGYSAISVSGVSGRTTRILLDGQDITDETVGTTIFNVSQGSIGEFQLNRSTQDVSGDITSTGQVLVSTQSGTNRFHGQAFYDFQDYRALFANVQGTPAPFQRNQYGGSIGGYIIKDKLFFFGNSERIKQDSSFPVTVGALFPQFGTLPLTTPYRETYSAARLDYNGPFGSHFFVRANYDVNAVDSNGGTGFQRYANRDNTPGLAGGADFQTGHFTHSFRGSYEKFHNFIADASAGALNLLPGVNFQNTVQNLYTGPNDLAPQATYQSDKQLRYDGTWTKGTHTVRYGASVNRIQGGGFAEFFGLGPRERESSTTQFSGPTATNPNALGCGGVAGAAPCIHDPLQGYHPSSIVLGNGLGFFTEHAGFGSPAGGTSDWRTGVYLSDNWKITPNFTLTAGARYTIDTGRANQDINQPLCSDVAGSAAALPPCTGSTPLASVLGSQFGALRVNQPYKNVAPQVGINYSPGNHKTTFRAAYGIFYEGDVFNNTTNARTNILKSGALFGDQSVCGNGTLNQPDGTKVTSVTANGQTETIAQVCAGTELNAAPYALALQALYQANAKANSQSANGAYIGNTLNFSGIYATNYKSPYSQQWNFGVQREIVKGGVIEADYIHNTTLRISQSVDVNHVGAARFLNVAAATAAITKTTAGAGCAGGASSVAIGCAITALGSSALQKFAANGLDSGNTFLQGDAASYAGKTPATGAAFPGANPLIGSGSVLQPIGKSGYDAFQVVYRQSKAHPVPFVDRANVELSYDLSRIVSDSGGGSDEFFSNGSFDNDNPAYYTGRASLDHKHQLSFGGFFNIKYGPQVGIVGHFASASPTTLTLDSITTSGAVGNIFQTDITGDGTTNDVAPGTLPGDYMHRIKPTSLGAYISNFNSKYAYQLTPAGQALVSAGLFNPTQLQQIGASIQPIATLAQPRALSNAAIRSLDANFSYPIHLNRFREGLSLEPGIAFYNVFNFSSFGGPSGTLQNVPDVGAVNTQTGSVNGADVPGVLEQFRVGRGSGTFDAGGPRSTEFQLKLNF